MKILAFSDTHGLHRELPEPLTHDVAIFAGDCGGERMWRFLDFLDWFCCVTDKPKVMVYGNHERWPDRQPEQAHYEVCNRGIHLLMGSRVAIDGVTIWGCPYTPSFLDWSFMSDEYDWDQIPDKVDVLVTHGPPKGTLDMTQQGNHAGCPGLASVLPARELRTHIFGHIHEARGIDGIHHNVSCVDRQYKLYPEPWTLIEI